MAGITRTNGKNDFRGGPRIDRQRASMTDEERLAGLEDMLAAANVTLENLLSSANETASFGDQSFKKTDINKIFGIRDRLRAEIQAVESKIHGRRGTIKVHF